MILLKLTLLFSLLMIIGTILTLALFNFDFARFKKSELLTKIVFWVPIFIVFTFIAFSSDFVKFLSLCLLSTIIIYEYIKAISKTPKKLFFILYLAFLLVALFHFMLLNLLKIDLTNLILVLGISSALSDVTAFFFGKYGGVHKLPHFINPNKSWEGVLGQVIGALLGVVLIKLFLFKDINLFLFIPIGVGSALGDLINSFMKRKLKIVNWSNVLPGHGGFIDRFSSLAGSAVITYYFMLLFD